MLASAIWTLTSVDYFVFKVKAVARYSAEKILDKGADKAIDKVFDFIKDREVGRGGDDVHRLFLEPSCVGWIVRKEVMFQNLKPGFKGSREKYDGVAYASCTGGPNYFWAEYTNNAPKSIYKPMVNAWLHMMDACKAYFADPENLTNFVESKIFIIKKRFQESSPETQAAIIQLLEEVVNSERPSKEDFNCSTENYQACATGYKYVAKFLERRRAEGGDELVETYKELAKEILRSLDS
ncbi:MAG: hypothetical protein K9M44_00490 [Candidatus Pacebacteria bacterium]|nr:hypothetical protein [Candidatus Paceibacterota bacterium]